MEEREGQKKKLPIWAKILIAAGALAALFLTVFFLRDVPPFSAYRIFMKRTVNSAVNDKERTETDDERVVEAASFEEIDNTVPFKVTRPLWLPEGFALEYVDYKKINDNYTISYKYILSENNEEFIEFNIREAIPIDPQGFTVDFEEFLINEIKVYVLNLDEDGMNAEYTNNQGLMVVIGGTISQETLIKIIENMS